MRRWSTAGTRLRFLRARLLTVTAQLMIKFVQVDKIAFAKFLAGLLDSGDLFGLRLVFPKLPNSLLYRTGVGDANVMPQRIAHEFGTRAVLLAADALKLVRHCGRE
jgi:hypothetical protein